jgi:hypothetical protein
VMRFVAQRLGDTRRLDLAKLIAHPSGHSRYTKKPISETEFLIERHIIKPTATIFKSIIHQHKTIAMRSHAMYTLFMSLGPTNQKMAQICCLCCAYVSSGIGRLVN